jgi:hypothetical protein
LRPCPPPRPSAGRDALFQQLAWLQQAAEPPLLVSDAAGRAKAEPSLTVLYCPFSILLNWADERDGMQLRFTALQPPATISRTLA